jgi:hypothetical protein
MKTIIFLLMFAVMLFAGTSTEIKLGRTLNADSTSAQNTVVYIEDAETVFSSLISTEGVTIGWAKLAFRFESVSAPSTQGFEVLIRFYDKKVGYTTGWNSLGTFNADDKNGIYLSLESFWQPASGIQLMVIISGTGKVKPIINILKG